MHKYKNYGLIKMNMAKKFVFLLGLLLAFISISAMTSYYKPKEKKEVEKDY